MEEDQGASKIRNSEKYERDWQYHEHKTAITS